MKKIRIICKVNSSKSLYYETTIDYAFDCKSEGKSISKGLFSYERSRNIDLITTNRVAGDKNEENTVRKNRGEGGRIACHERR